MKNTMLHFRTLMVCLFLFQTFNVLAGQSLTNPETESRIDALISKMTLAEKVGQLNQYSSILDLTGPPPEGGREKIMYDDLANGRVGSMLNVLGADATRAAQKLVVENSRLGIPLIFGYDVIHGYQTIFPVPLAESASWDLEAMERSARIAAIEASAAGIHWTFGPMVDIARDSRWGRIMEGAGEDPYLGSLIAAARVRGFQGADLSAIDTLAACAKHFAGYGFSQAGRDYNIVDISDDTLHNMVLPPFKAAVDAGVVTFMNSFNEIGGVPASSSYELQTTLLKQDWGFDGFIVSDWGSIGELVEHGVANDDRHAASLAINTGNDMDMESSAYRDHLVSLVSDGVVPVERVDDAVRRVLRVKFALGVMDDPYGYSNPDRETAAMKRKEHLAAARDMARKSIVLLKNKNMLPLNKAGESLAVIGPLAADKDVPLGSWRGQGQLNSAVSLLEGIKTAVGAGAEVHYARGAALGIGEGGFAQEVIFNTDDRSGFAEAVKAAENADKVIMAIGEMAFQTGEGRSQTDVGLKGVQLELLDAVLKVNKNVIVVLINGRPLTISSIETKVPAIVEAWQLGSESGNAIADVLFGNYNPSGKLTVSFPRHVGQEPLYYNHKNTGRPVSDGGAVFWSHYTDIANTPLYPFGFGLSYTSFEYSKPGLSSSEMTMDGGIDVSFTLSNTGKLAGTEIAQLYVRDMVGSVTRPVLELKGFQRVTLAAGETKQLTFKLTAKDLAYYTPRGKWETEPGAFKIFVGGNSVDTQSAGIMLK